VPNFGLFFAACIRILHGMTMPAHIARSAALRGLLLLSRL